MRYLIRLALLNTVDTRRAFSLVHDQRDDATAGDVHLAAQGMPSVGESKRRIKYSVLNEYILSTTEDQVVLGSDGEGRRQRYVCANVSILNIKLEIFARHEVRRARPACANAIIRIPHNP